MADDTWTSEVALPTARYALTSETVGNHLVYVIGGIGDGDRTENEEYDKSTDTWTVKAAMPTARYGLASGITSGDLIYVVGGEDSSPLATNEEYDPSTDTWTSKAPMPTARTLLGADVVNDLLYAIGGADANGDELDTNEEYDPSTDTWTSKAPMPGTRQNHGVTAASDGLLYSMGGYSAGSHDSLDSYDPASDAWSGETLMPDNRERLSASSLSYGRFYAIGGYKSGEVLASNDEYNTANGSWTARADMPTARYWPTASTFGDDTIAAVGGYNSGFRTENERYDPPGSSGAGSAIKTETNADPKTASLNNIVTAPAARKTMARASPRLGFYANQNWLISGKPAGTASSVKLKHDELKIIFNVNKEQLKEIFRPLRADAGKQDKAIGSDGSYRVYDISTGNNNTRTVSPPFVMSVDSRAPLLRTAQYTVASYSEKLTNSQTLGYRVSLSLTPRFSRDEWNGIPNFNDREPAGNDWEFGFYRGRVTTKRVTAEPSGEGDGGVEQTSLTVVLEPKQAKTLAESAAYLDAVKIRDVPDHDNLVDDNSEEKRNSVYINVPDAKEPILDTGPYRVLDWELEWAGTGAWVADMTVAPVHPPAVKSVADFEPNVARRPPRMEGTKTATAATPLTSPVTTVSAIIDSWEDADIAEYTGDTTNFAVVSTGPTPVDGSYILEHQGSKYDQLYSQSGLDYYPEAGDAFKFYFQDTNGSANAQFGMFFGAQDASDSDTYEVRYEADQDDFLLVKWSAGSATILSSNNSLATSYTASTWWRIEIDWGASGGITVTLYDHNNNVIESLSATDTTYTTGGIGFRSRNSATSSGIYYDYARIL